MVDLHVFEDNAVSQLDPIAIGKPAFAIHCGSYRLIDLLDNLKCPITAHVRPHLRALVDADYCAADAEGLSAGKKIFVNARLVPSVATRQELERLIAAGKLGAVRDSHGNIAVAIVDDKTVVPPVDVALAAASLAPLEGNLSLFEYPHDVLRHHLQIFGDNLSDRLARGKYREIADGVFLAEGATIDSMSVKTDTKRGPIVLEAGATVGPYCYLSGPLHLGANTRVLEYTALKDGVAAGHTVKIGGEVEASIIESYTNKQHHGFLGHSYLGSWVNLGAGTCNSDLKNTYGLVNMEYRGQKVKTDMQFIGTIVGDYAKTAINTGIFTGKTVGVCSMVYGFVTTNVPSYVNYARLFGQVTEAPVEVMVSTQRRMFARRGVEQRPCDIQLLHDMHALTMHERNALGESLSIEPLSL
jgi:UDP-N-acetylglucosamine diphosphorylase/glucosamine-1-phosphate N-acetyltransferase